MINFKDLLKKVTIVIVLLLVLNTLHIFNFYLVKFGNLNFFSFQDHLFVFLNSVVALASTLISWHFSKKISRETIRRLIVTFCLALGLFILLTSVYYILMRLLAGETITPAILPSHIIFSFSTAFIHVSGLTLAVLYFHETNKLDSENLNLKKEKHLLQHQLLTKNLEPHFLLNSLNSFSYMMRKNPDEAEEFLDHFASVYRYFIRHNQADIVSLSEELTFLGQYLFLLEKRFGDTYRVEIDIKNTSGFLIPFALQICVENAIIHNEGFEDNPLQITIWDELPYVIVSNPLRPIRRIEGSGTGLQNLIQRNRYISGREVLIKRDTERFVVKIPIITDID